jgi:hypothetical protein
VREQTEGFHKHVNCVMIKHGKATTIFDGYDNGPDIKDAMHQKRNHGSGPTVVMTAQIVVTLNKADFLSNKANKQRFLSILGLYL